MRAVIYTRVSSDPQGEGRSVESQEAECRSLCERNGWEVAEVLMDNDRGASRYSAKSRPEYRRLTNVLASGDVQVLVTWEASRAQRDLSAYLPLRDLCADRGVFWCYSGKLHDLTRGDDRFTTGLDALIAEREAEMTRERVLRGKRAAALKGLPGGRPAWGYRRDIDPRTGKTTAWVVDVDAEPLVREVFSRVLAGESVWSVCRDFTQRGIRPPQLQKNARQDWKPQSLARTICSPSYAGWRVHQGLPVLDEEGRRVKGLWVPYISDLDHQRLVAILSDPARTVTAHRGHEPRHLLTGIATCGLCGSVMRFTGSQRSRVRAPRYLCEKTSCVGRRADLVDLLVEETLLARLEREDVARLLAKVSHEDVTEALAEADTLRARLASFVEQAIAGKLSMSVLAQAEAKLLPLIDSAEAKAKAKVTSPLVAKLAGPNARQTWAKFSVVDKRTVVRSLLRIEINKVHHGNSRRFDCRDVDVQWKVSTE